MYHNIHFDLLKAFQIYLEVIYEKDQQKASELARTHNLTYKTKYNFKQKVIIGFGFMEFVRYLRKNKLSNDEKLMGSLRKYKIFNFYGLG